MGECSLKDLNNVTDTRNTPSVQTVPVSSSALFIIPDYLICMRYPRVCVTLRETKQVQKRLCVAILAFFFFLLSDWNVRNTATPKSSKSWFFPTGRSCENINSAIGKKNTKCYMQRIIVNFNFKKFCLIKRLLGKKKLSVLFGCFKCVIIYEA